MCSLKVKDFYQDAGYWVLDFTIKGGKKNKIAIHQELKLALMEYLEVSGHGEERQAPIDSGGAALESAAAPESVPGKPDLSWVRPDGRATFITEALENNCPIEAVQRSVGHVRIATTQMYDKRLLKHRQSASFAVHY